MSNACNHDAMKDQSNDPFSDPPIPPPPAYNFHSPNPQSAPVFENLESQHPLIAKNSSESPRIQYNYHHRQRYYKRRLLCFLFAFLVLIIIGLTVFGAVLHWGNSKYCVKWNDGTTSGDCTPDY